MRCAGAWHSAGGHGLETRTPAGFSNMGNAPDMGNAPKSGARSVLAEEGGFEPPLPGLQVKRFSRPPHSTALPPLREVHSGMVTGLPAANNNEQKESGGGMPEAHRSLGEDPIYSLYARRQLKPIDLGKH